MQKPWPLREKVCCLSWICSCFLSLWHKFWHLSILFSCNVLFLLPYFNPLYSVFHMIRIAIKLALTASAIKIKIQKISFVTEFIFLAGLPPACVFCPDCFFTSPPIIFGHLAFRFWIFICFILTLSPALSYLGLFVVSLGIELRISCAVCCLLSISTLYRCLYSYINLSL